MASHEELINQLSDLCGIIPEYWDIRGTRHVTSLQTKTALLRAMRMNTDSSGVLLEEIKKRTWRHWEGFIEPVHVLSVHQRPVTIPVHIPIGANDAGKVSLTWSIQSEEGQREEFTVAGDALPVVEEQRIDDRDYIKVHLPDLGYRDIGYYQVEVTCRHSGHAFPGGGDLIRKASRLIITPDTCYIPPELLPGRAWGVSLSLYAVRSSRNWGIGDLSDLRRIVRWVAGLKGDLVGVNPLHAISNTRPLEISPYHPLSRLYKNLVYLDLEKVPEVKECIRALTPERSASLKNQLVELRKRDLIDYEQVGPLKERFLRSAFSLFHRQHYTKQTARGMKFKEYITEEGDSLDSFALFLTLRKDLEKLYGTRNWKEWPQKFQDKDSSAVRKVRKKRPKEILFYKYIQWLIDEELCDIANLSRKLGMAVGTYHDLAIGSAGGGSDAWNFREVFGEADVGAPPDDFTEQGQNWGFPPFIPEKLYETGYELFIQTMRRNMKHFGALRIDHALGLFRLFWIPTGMAPHDGAYVRCPSEDLLRIITLESVRNRTMVIAEDLGTVGDNVRETLQRFHMLSYKLLYFERNYPDPSLLEPQKYPEMALCSVTTHDLPTLYGYWSGADLEKKKQLGLFPDEETRRQQSGMRERDKVLILSALRSQGIIGGDLVVPSQMSGELCLAIYRYLAKTPCKLLLVNLDDIIGTLSQQNMPGTVDAYPNWMQKTPLSLERIVSDKRFIALSAMLKEAL